MVRSTYINNNKLDEICKNICKNNVKIYAKIFIKIYVKVYVKVYVKIFIHVSTEDHITCSHLTVSRDPNASHSIPL